MAKRKPVVGMSLKTYLNSIEYAKEFSESIRHLTEEEKEIELFLFPSLGTIYPVSEILKGSSIGIGAQNIAPELNGAYTGEFSIESLIDMGGEYVEIGHSERRNIFRETDELINKKIALTLEEGLIPVLCIGEKEKTADFSSIKNYLENQLCLDLKRIPSNQLEKIIIAYEPIWAIGASEAADIEHIGRTFESIREILSNLFGKSIAEKIRIIYGGSVSKENVKDISKEKQVDGVFIGRFGHDPQNYKSIVQTVKKEKLNNKK